MTACRRVMRNPEAEHLEEARRTKPEDLAIRSRSEILMKEEAGVSNLCCIENLLDLDKVKRIIAIYAS